MRAVKQKPGLLRRGGRITVAEVSGALEAIAPLGLADARDNVGLLIGEPSRGVGRLMLCIDLTAAVLAEAIALKASMVMAYHPVIYRPLSRLTSQAAPIALQAARAGIAIYSVHTAFDSAVGGMNDMLADAIGLASRRPIVSAVIAGNCKLVVFVPPDDLARVAQAAFDAGAGRIGDYTDCSFFMPGVGTFRGGRGTHPAVGKPGRHEAVQELRLEIVCPRGSIAAVVAAVRSAHSYEQPVIDVYCLDEYPDGCGQGRIGELHRPTSLASLIRRLKQTSGVKRVSVAVARNDTRANASASEPIRRVACLAGAGGEYLPAALAMGAELFVTGELRHHDALLANRSACHVICLGHSNSERFALRHLAARISQALPRLSVLVSKADRDPFDII